MRVLVHDYSGHPSQVQLSRRLAVRGYEVLHLYFGAFQTPRGSVCRLQCDPEGFDCRPLDLGTDFRKHDFFKRWIQEWQYGYRLVRETEGFAPDAVISANTPLDPQSLLLRHCRSRKIPFVFWLQDIYGAAIRRILSSRWPLRGRVVGSRYVALENRLLRRSDRVVAITEDFLPYLEAAGVDRDRIDVIHNWAPLDEVPEKPKDNPWSREAGLAEGFCFLYSGTLAMKHDPDVLARLAESFRGRREAKVAVVSEGPGAEHLRREKVRRSLDNLAILPFQPFEVFPEVLGRRTCWPASSSPRRGRGRCLPRSSPTTAPGGPCCCRCPARTWRPASCARTSRDGWWSPGTPTAFSMRPASFTTTPPCARPWGATPGPTPEGLSMRKGSPTASRRSWTKRRRNGMERRGDAWRRAFRNFRASLLIKGNKP